MTEHDLQLLLSGSGIGFQLAVAMFVVWQIRDSRREQKRDAALLAEARAHIEAEKGQADR